MSRLLPPPLFFLHDAHATAGTPMDVWRGGIATKYASRSPSQIRLSVVPAKSTFRAPSRSSEQHSRTNSSSTPHPTTAIPNRNPQVQSSRCRFFFCSQLPSCVYHTTEYRVPCECGAGACAQFFPSNLKSRRYTSTNFLSASPPIMNCPRGRKRACRSTEFEVCRKLRVTR